MRAMLLIGKVLIKIILLPVILGLTLLQWMCVTAVSAASIIFDFIGGVFIVTGIICYLMGQEPLSMMRRMILSGSFFCLLPKVGEWIAVRITYINMLIKAFLISG